MVTSDDDGQSGDIDVLVYDRCRARDECVWTHSPCVTDKAIRRANGDC